MPRRNIPQPHKPFHFASHCAQKRRFATEKAAEQVVDDQIFIDSKVKLSVYKCEHCSGWHLTRRIKTQ